jgi:hypothetical protein
MIIFLLLPNMEVLLLVHATCRWTVRGLNGLTRDFFTFLGQDRIEVSLHV